MNFFATSKPAFMLLHALFALHHSCGMARGLGCSFWTVVVNQASAQLLAYGISNESKGSHRYNKMFCSLSLMQTIPCCTSTEKVLLLPVWGWICPTPSNFSASFSLQGICKGCCWCVQLQKILLVFKQAESLLHNQVGPVKFNLVSICCLCSI